MRPATRRRPLPRLAALLAAACAAPAFAQDGDGAACWSATAVSAEGETALSLTLHPRRSETDGPFFEVVVEGAAPSGDMTLRVGNRTLPLDRDGARARLEGDVRNREVIDLIDYATPAQVFVSLYESGQMPAATYGFSVRDFERAVYADPRRCL